jgi:hypothetical protein
MTIFNLHEIRAQQAAKQAKRLSAHRKVDGILPLKISHAGKIPWRVNNTSAEVLQQSNFNDLHQQTHQ